MRAAIATKLVIPVPGDHTLPVKVSVYPDGECLLSQDRRSGWPDIQVIQQVIQMHPSRIPELIDALEAVFEAWANRPLYREPSTAGEA